VCVCRTKHLGAASIARRSVQRGSFLGHGRNYWSNLASLVPHLQCRKFKKFKRQRTRLCSQKQIDDNSEGSQRNPSHMENVDQRQHLSTVTVHGGLWKHACRWNKRLAVPMNLACLHSLREDCQGFLSHQVAHLLGLRHFVGGAFQLVPKF